MAHLDLTEEQLAWLDDSQHRCPNCGYADPEGRDDFKCPNCDYDGVEED